MQGAILIFGGNQKNREEKAIEILNSLDLKNPKNNPDILTIEKPEDKKSIGIEQVRKGIKFLSEKPFSHKNKAILVNKAHLLTIPAQNAFLKILEEPPNYATTILCAKTENDLLETVISRCRKIDVGRGRKFSASTQKSEPISKILKMPPGQRLSWAEQFSKNEKEEIVETLDAWISELRENLSKQPEMAAQAIQKITEIKSDLEKTNVNTRLAIEHLLLSI